VRPWRKTGAPPALQFRDWQRRIALEALFIFICCLTTTVTGGKWKCWRRNSLALGYWSEQSDLDLTFFREQNLPPPWALLVLWKIFRRLGEWAAYCGTDHAWAAQANPLELARDPRLALLIMPAARKASRSECFAFWLRMVGSDAFLTQPSKAGTRWRKWNFHRARIEEASGLACSSAFPEFIGELGERLSPIPRAEWAEHESLIHPHSWFWPAYRAGQATPECFANHPPALLDVARAQVRWEIWGLLGQVRLRGNLAEVSRHIELLAGLFPSHDPIRSVAQEFQLYLRERIAQ
jgi:hypothetical protein